MRLLFCYLCPPFAVLMCGRPFSAILNCLFTCWFWIPGVKHALIVYADWKHETAHEELVAATHAPKWSKALHQPPQQQVPPTPAYPYPYPPPQVVYVQAPPMLPAQPAPVAPAPVEAPAPAPKRRKKEAPQLIDDPLVGAHGTVFYKD